MSIYISEIQYRGKMNYGHGYHHSVPGPDRFQRNQMREDGLRAVSALPPEIRKAAWRYWKSHGSLDGFLP